MKINDIINEQQLDELGWQDFKNVGSKVSSAFTGAKTGVQANRAGQAGADRLEQTSKLFIDKRNASVTQNPAINNSNSLKSYAEKLAPGLSATVPVPNELNPTTVSTYLTAVVGKQLASSTATDTPPPPPTATDTTEPTTSTIPSGNEMAQKLATDWKAFVDAGGNAGPALKQQLKQMWLDAGVIKAESKKNKKQPV